MRSWPRSKVNDCIHALNQRKHAADITQICLMIFYPLISQLAGYWRIINRADKPFRTIEVCDNCPAKLTGGTGNQNHSFSKLSELYVEIGERFIIVPNF